jgi:tripartite-type tricarboxylate transporter receptor subunit TctC
LEEYLVRASKLIIAAAALVMSYSVSAAHADEFPSKPVNVILPYPTGTGPDTVMRLVGDKLKGYWGQPVTIENKPGANYWSAVDAFKKGKPDGYTLFQTENWMIALQRHLFKKLPYDPDKDFSPVSPMFQANYFLTVAAGSPWKTVSDVISAAKAEDGQLTFGSSGVGGAMHMGGAKLQNATGIKLTHVPVKETPQIFVQIANGELSMAFGTASTAGPMLRGQKVKFIAIADKARNPNFPDVPTFAEAGGPVDFVHKSWLALFAPQGTPKPVIDKINTDVTRALNEPDVKAKLASIGFTPWTSTPEELAGTLAEETRLMGEIAKSQNISLD